MPATSTNSRSARASRSRLPFTPKVTATRRGGHSALRPVRTADEVAPVAATPSFHLTPNVVSAARGGLTPSIATPFTDAYKAGALDMRGLRF